MGAKPSVIDEEMRNLVTDMGEMVRSKSLLQYRISQLKLFNEQRSAFPSITEVKDTQLLLIKLEKEINDTTNLLDSIQGTKEEEHLQALEDTYTKLKTLLEERQLEAIGLEADVQNEARVHEELKSELDVIKVESERLKYELFQVKESENFRMLRKINDEEEEIEKAIRQNEEKKKQLMRNKSDYLNNRNTTKVTSEMLPRDVSPNDESKMLRIPRLRLATIDIERSILAKSMMKSN